MTPVKLITGLAPRTVELDIRLPTIPEGPFLHLSQRLLLRKMTGGLRAQIPQKMLAKTSRYKQLQILIGSIRSLEPPIHNAFDQNERIKLPSNSPVPSCRSPRIHGVDVPRLPATAVGAQC